MGPCEGEDLVKRPDQQYMVVPWEWYGNMSTNMNVNLNISTSGPNSASLVSACTPLLFLTCRAHTVERGLHNHHGIDVKKDASTTREL